jgi:hypothetical protein
MRDSWAVAAEQMTGKRLRITSQHKIEIVSSGEAPFKEKSSEVSHWLKVEG